MNVYFLVEGQSTEKKVYPKWLSYLVPHMKRVDFYDEIKENNYFIFSAGGYPTILDDIISACEEVNECGRYDYLVICVDGDDIGWEERRNELLTYIDENVDTVAAEIVVIVQNVCFETWFLGNRKVFSRNPGPGFQDYFHHYDISSNDPEEMEKPDNCGSSKSQYHVDYLKSMLDEKNMQYSKKLPGAVCSEHYIKELEKRVEETPHLKSLAQFFYFCTTLKTNLKRTYI